MTGTIHNLNDRGFGFIAPDGDGSRDGRHFFHASNLVGIHFSSLKVGEPVEFESVRGERGLEAREVRPVSQQEQLTTCNRGRQPVQ
jgi:CspA family cold shock protein